MNNFLLHPSERTASFVGWPGHPVYRIDFYGCHCWFGPAYNAYTYTASTS